MPDARLSALDASFLAVEKPTAHMHVGWAAVFDPPAGRSRPTFAELRDHIGARLERAPRYRQRLAPVPLGVHEPAWVDDDRFDLGRHVLHARARRLEDILEAVLSVPLERDRPLWELWIADDLADGRLGLVGKVHHCMVDGAAAVELGTLLLDAEPSANGGGEVERAWRPAPVPGSLELLVRGLRDRVAEQAGLIRMPLDLLRSPGRMFDVPAAGLRLARSLAAAALPLAPPSALNAPSSPLRALYSLERPLADLKTIRKRTGTTVNDVVLAAAAGGLREFFLARGDEPVDLKAMVPVNVRDAGAAGDLGNRISFMFVGLPCTEADPARRLALINEVTCAHKDSGAPADTDAALKALAYAPPPVQHAISQLVSGPRAFNLVVSNIPGPGVPLWLHGCLLQQAYPVVPLAAEHALSIGVTTVRDAACFGFYADRKALPDASDLPDRVDAAIEELLRVTGGPRLRPVPPPAAGWSREPALN
jgi:WS/DGAT/MGAT family acyltransferase